MIGCSILSFRISYGGVAMGHHVEQFVIGAYIIVFLLCSVAELYFIIRLVKKMHIIRKSIQYLQEQFLLVQDYRYCCVPLFFRVLVRIN